MKIFLLKTYFRNNGNSNIGRNFLGVCFATICISMFIYYFCCCHAYIFCLFLFSSSKPFILRIVIHSVLKFNLKQNPRGNIFKFYLWTTDNCTWFFIQNFLFLLFFYCIHIQYCILFRKSSCMVDLCFLVQIPYSIKILIMYITFMSWRENLNEWR